LREDVTETTSNSVMNMKVTGHKSRSHELFVFYVHDTAAICGQYLTLNNA